MAVLIASVVLLHVLFCALAILVIILYRQFGLVYMGSRRSNELTGPAAGEQAPAGLRVANPESGAQHGPRLGGTPAGRKGYAAASRRRVLPCV
ncbi:MAG: hypothetical protein M3Z75_24635 [Actinomycetota bacterium]|nr:hypothetical protein [Actinomycetota bacterium]